MKIILTSLVLLSITSKAQSHYPDNGKYLEGLSSLGNLWAYVERIDKSLDSAHATIDSLRMALYNNKMLLQFNVDATNFYIKRMDSFPRHGVGIYPSYHKLDTLALGPFYLY